MRGHLLSGISGSVPATLAAALLLVPLAAPHAAHLEKVVDGIDKPVYLTSPPDDPRLFVIEMRGRIRIVEDGELLPTPFLDISSLVETDGLFQGILGLAFPPDYATSGRFYVNYTAPGLESRIARYEVSGDPDVADPGSGEVLLTVPQPGYDHNGGYLAFGPDDGYLYASATAASVAITTRTRRIPTCSWGSSSASTSAFPPGTPFPPTTRSWAIPRPGMRSGRSGSAHPGA